MQTRFMKALNLWPKASGQVATALPENAVLFSQMMRACQLKKSLAVDSHTAGLHTMTGL
jgi:hypothetical protein